MRWISLLDIYGLRIFMVWGWRSCHDCTHTHTHMIHTTYIFCLPCGSSHFRAGTACLVHIFSLHYIDLACMFTASSASRRDSSHFRANENETEKFPTAKSCFKAIDKDGGGTVDRKEMAGGLFKVRACTTHTTSCCVASTAPMAPWLHRDL